MVRLKLLWSLKEILHRHGEKLRLTHTTISAEKAFFRRNDFLYFLLGQGVLYADDIRVRNTTYERLRMRNRSFLQNQ
ncbi:MAG: hypothetical protein ABJZ92_07340 [Cyclobacteriaceae bacterium]